MRSQFAALCLAGGLLFVTETFGADVSSGSPVTFHKDVQPILQRNCQSCHRPGQIGPMALLTFDDARPWAKAIKAAVASKKMPPWFAEPSVGLSSTTAL